MVEAERGANSANLSMMTVTPSAVAINSLYLTGWDKL